MGRRAKQAITGLSVVMLVVLLITGSVRASDQPAVMLEQAIQVVRQNFTIPAEFTNFTSSLSQYEGGQVWNLVWDRPDRSGGSFSAQVDADTGEVTAMNKWQPQTSGASRIPVVSWNDARQTAAQMLQRVIPSRMDSLVMIEEQEPSPFRSSGPVNYTVNWRRVANQIPVEGIGAWVNIDATNGEVLGYNLNWTHLPLPDPKGIVSAETAQLSFIQNDIIKLEYQLPEQSRLLTGGAEAAKPLLAYIIDHSSNGVIDAFTGKPMVPAWSDQITNGKGMGGMSEDQALPGAIPLTPEEQREIEDLAGLISQEQAAQVIFKWAQAKGELVLRSASLERDWRYPDVRIWSLNWSSPAGDDNLTQYLYGRVDARSGELLSLTLGLPRGEQATNGLSQAEARRLAENFLSRVQGTRFSQFQLDTDAPDPFIGSDVPISEWPTWNFRFIRIQDGIPFPANGVDIAIDRAHERVTSYTLNWDYSSLPPATGVIGLEQANRIYLGRAPLTLTYVPYYSAASKDTEMRLVYLPRVPDGQPSFRMLDAFSGDLLNNAGQPANTRTTGHVFNDVAGNFAEKEIGLLGKAGLMTEYGDAFHPGEPIAAADLLRAMLSIYQGPEAVRELSAGDIIKRALAQGWLEEEMAPESTVERDLLAQIMVRSLGLEYLAEIPEIYRLPYSDAASISQRSTGYVALCWGLGIIRADGVRFEPQYMITRAEAASALINSLRIKR